ncbi:MAG TPA: WYL domain-containing protein [Acidimicrobiales bacterium]|nr:WYL domain-containing protein [Acidimicrobiales bacterium]
MLETSARLLRLLSLLQARPTWTAPELADRLGVTDRTVRRDVTRLRDLGYPVEAEPGPYGGYRLGRGGALPPLLLDDDEAVAVAVGLRAAADGSVVGLDDATVSALAKLDQVLPARLAARVRAVHGATAELSGRDPDRVDAEVLVTLAQACRAGERVRLGYAARAGTGTARERPVDPYRLVRSGPRWYLVARDVERGEWRTYRLDRVTAAVPTGGRSDLADPPDPVAFVAAGMAVGPYAVRATVRLGLPAAQALELVPRTVGVHRPDGPRATVVVVGGGSVAGLTRYLAGLGVLVEVLDPPELRASLRSHAEALAATNRD